MKIKFRWNKNSDETKIQMKKIQMELKLIVKFWKKSNWQNLNCVNTYIVTTLKLWQHLYCENKQNLTKLKLWQHKLLQNSRCDKTKIAKYLVITTWQLNILMRWTLGSLLQFCDVYILNEVKWGLTNQLLTEAQIL